MTVEYASTKKRRKDGGDRRWTRAIWYGLLRRCPKCGIGRLFRRYLKVGDTCGNCTEELHHHRADDAPPYFTIFIVGHIVVPLALIAERAWQPPIWLHMALWLPLTVLLTLVLLPSVKGAVVGLQWALRMHGFEYSAVCRPNRDPEGD